MPYDMVKKRGKKEDYSSQVAYEKLKNESSSSSSSSSPSSPDSVTSEYSSTSSRKPLLYAAKRKSKKTKTSMRI